MKKAMEAFREFNRERDWEQFHTPENLAKSIVIEAAELLECFQWNSDFDRQDVQEELADVLSYCIQMADVLGMDPEKIVLEKFEKTKKKYPASLVRGSSQKYTEYRNKEREFKD